MQKTTIIIPCYNESGRLPVKVIEEYLTANTNVSFILIDDASTDDTAELIRALADKHDRVEALYQPLNAGKAEAVRRGINTALENSPAYVGYWDADMATPLSEISDFLTHFNTGGYSAVFGCRLARLGAEVYRKDTRHYIGRVFATVVSNLLRIKVYDTQCGAKIFTAGLAREIFAQPFITRWLFDVELLKRIIKLHGKEKTAKIVYEYPLMHWRDVGGSKLKLSTMLKTPLYLMQIFLGK
ncbi:MAG: glycosyltransferase [Victivallales bacterium]|nr:glycosyltransferase [Victivallales bacterium]